VLGDLGVPPPKGGDWPARTIGLEDLLRPTPGATLGAQGLISPFRWARVLASWGPPVVGKDHHRPALGALLEAGERHLFPMGIPFRL